MELPRCSTFTTRRLLPPPPPTSSSSYNLPTKTSLSPSGCSLLSFSSSSSSSTRGLVPLRRSGSDRTRTPRRRAWTCRCLLGLGVPELAVIAGVAALVFGPKQIPEIGRSIGKTVKSFQRAAKEFELELKKDADDGSQPPAVEGLKDVGSEGMKKEPET